MRETAHPDPHRPSCLSLSVCLSLPLSLSLSLCLSVSLSLSLGVRLIFHFDLQFIIGDMQMRFRTDSGAVRERERGFREGHRADPRDLRADHYLGQLPRTSRLIRTESKNRVVRPRGCSRFPLAYGAFVSTSSLNRPTGDVAIVTLCLPVSFAGRFVHSSLFPRQ